MILNTTNDERRRFEVLARTGQIGVELLAEGVVSQECLAVFRREHEVRVELDQGLRHVRKPFV